MILRLKEVNNMLLFTSFFFGLVFVTKCASGGEKLSCQVDIEKDKIINIKATLKRNDTEASVFRGLHSASSSECQKECCSNSNCTLFVYHHIKEKKYSCFLVRCLPESNCVYQELEGSLIGHVSRALPLAKALVLSASDLTVSQPTVSSASDTLVQSSSILSTSKTLSQTTAPVSTTVKGFTSAEVHSTPVTPKGSTVYEPSVLLSATWLGQFQESSRTTLNTPYDRLQESLVTHSSTPVDQLTRSPFTYSNRSTTTSLGTPENQVVTSTSNNMMEMSGSLMAFFSVISPGQLSDDVSLSPSAAVSLSPLSSVTTPLLPVTLTIITSPSKNSDIAEGMFENCSTTSLLPSLISVTSSVEGKKNVTALNDHSKKAPKKLDEHTTAASLVIALCFGILFLFAVVILIGRPWWDAFHRPRYSKVDYLMNGL